MWVKARDLERLNDRLCSLERDRNSLQDKIYEINKALLKLGCRWVPEMPGHWELEGGEK